MSNDGKKTATADSEIVVYEEGQSSESVTNVCNSAGPPQDYDSSDTSLKLGLVYLTSLINFVQDISMAYASWYEINDEYFLVN